MKTWNRVDLRKVQPWHTDLHFEDGKAERALDATTPRLVVNAISSAGALRLASRFTECESAQLEESRPTARLNLHSGRPQHLVEWIKSDVCYRVPGSV